MKAIWSGAIGFGLVNIPIKLYSAIQESDLDLHMLDPKDYASIKFKRVNEKTGKEVSYASIVKAYDLNGKYVVLSDEDFEKAMPEKTKIIEIDSFAGVDEIDTMLFEVAYYAQPAKGGERAYNLLLLALQKSKKVGVGSFVLRNKEKLCLIKAGEDCIIVQRIHFAEEIRNTSELEISKQAPKPNEIKMAIHLIDQLTETFDISKFKDTYSEKLMKLIKAKGAGKAIKQPVMKVAYSKTKDLMSQLEASLNTKGRKAS